MAHTAKVTIGFYGAAETVTGSKYVLKSQNQSVLVDCGMFQGKKPLREMNWSPLPMALKNIDAIFLTHAHLDHSGYLPVMTKFGFSGTVYCSEATRDLCEVLLLDAAKLQEEDASYMNAKGISKHHPALPLFDTDDANRALALFETVKLYEELQLGSIRASFIPNGHILGSSYILMQVEGKRILFSGDLGRSHDLIMHPPEPPCDCDYLVMESTYGDRSHEQRDVKDKLSDIICETALHGGTVLIPAFAVGRSQTILHVVHELKKTRKIPLLPIYLDSPMAIQATEVLYKHHRLHRLSLDQCKAIFNDVNFLRTVEQSMALNHITSPIIIISASGMATGGRVLYHLKRMLGNHRNSIVFAGYQASGTRGERLVAGEQSIKIHGQYYDVKAHIENLDFLSAHADHDEILQWLKQIPAPPKRCFITHGEVDAAHALQTAIEEELGWPAYTPKYGEEIEL